jgi:murein DD-endopeptidase MepM/ murein hydrolase activator NlpD
MMSWCTGAGGRIAETDGGLARFRFRDDHGHEADPSAPAVRRFLAAARAHPVLLDRPASQVSRLTFDWSAGSGAEGWTAQRLLAQLSEHGAQLGIGRYLEDRDVYTAQAYATAFDTGDDVGQRRTVHLGVDLLVPAGTAVSAPLDGVVHDLHDNVTPQDYGPVVVLAHRTDTGKGFFTLYGHLSRTTLDRLMIGQPVTAGERFATVGTQEENGGWVPHVHVQVLTSLLGMGVNVPGVGARGNLPFWRSVCPDPNLLLGLPEGTCAAPGLRTPDRSVCCRSL